MGITLPPYGRTRAKILPDVHASTDTSYQNFNGVCTNVAASSWIVRAPVDKVVEHRVETMSDTVTPHFEKIQGKGRMVNNPMSQYKEITYNPMMTYDTDKTYYVSMSCPPNGTLLGWRGARRFGGITQADSVSLPFVSIPSVDTQRCIDIALTKAWAKADLSKASALVTLGEAKETIQGTISIFKRLIRVIVAIKRADSKFLLSQLTPKELEARYMEFRYAIRPMYYDLAQIIDAAKHKKYDYDRWTFRATHVENDSNGGTGTIVWEPECKHSYSANSNIEVKVRAGVLCQVTEPSWAALWGLTNLPESIYDLLPLSFILDWFFNVGNTIAAWTPNTGLKALASWYVVEQTTFQHSIITGTTFVPIVGRNYISPLHEIHGGERSTLKITKTRVPSPKLTIFPSFNLRIDCLKLLDLVIIAKNLFTLRK